MLTKYNFMIDVQHYGEALAKLLEAEGFTNADGSALDVQPYSPKFHPHGYRITSFMCETNYYRPIPGLIMQMALKHSPDAVVEVELISNTV